jgi:hypothetical protein
MTKIEVRNQKNIQIISDDSWTLTEDGDAFEKAFFKEINQKLPAYQEIWAMFIGNDGNQKIVVIPSFPAEKKLIRQSFAEHHYTIAESAIALDEINTEIQNSSFEDTPTCSLKTLNSIVAFHGHMGRIVNNLEQLAYQTLRIYDQISDNISEDALSKDDRIKRFLESLQKYYYWRHIVLHGKKFPISVSTANEFMIPDFRIEKNSPAGWDKTLSWDEADKMILLKVYLNEINSDLIIEVNNVLERLKNIIYGYLKDKNLKMNQPAAKSNKASLRSDSAFQTYNMNTSGSTKTD